MAAQIVSLLSEQIQERVRRAGRAEKEVENMRSNLDAIQAALADAEERQLKEPAVKDWLDKLKMVCYDIDDVLDEWNTSDQKSLLNEKVWPFLSSLWFSWGRIFLHYRIASNIQDLNGKLDLIAQQKERYNFDLNRGSNQVERLVTTSFVDVTEVRGRDHDKSEIIDKLLGESSANTPTLRIISIVGIGGIGKTTLAQLVYNDSKVTTHFKERIWVCVSDPFDEIRIAKAILESLNCNGPHVNELETILGVIRQIIKRKMFLLVLDDVWNEHPNKWRQLKASLTCGLPGSRILVTTRNENVATLMGCVHSDIYKIGLLPRDECWSVFSQVALDGVERESLEDIGREIVAKCKGLPLAVRTLGGLLRFKASRKEWLSVLNSDLWSLEDAKRDLFGPLCLSYYDLSSPLKQCFSYCAMFPKDYEFEKEKLILHWMAQGYLTSTQNDNMEEVGEEYVQKLAARSLFQDIKKNVDTGSIVRFKMHDVVHDFAQFIAKNECCSSQLGDTPQERRVDSRSEEMRHAMIQLKGNMLFPSSFCYFKKLRSLFVEDGRIVEYVEDDKIDSLSLCNLFTQLTCLRSLSLIACRITQIPPGVSKLIHLRELDLRWNIDLRYLSDEVCELYNLQTLNVDYCGMERLPDGIGKLINLRHVFNSHTKIKTLPKGVRMLISLRTLSVFIAKKDVEGAASLCDMKNLNDLQGQIKILISGDYEDVGEARQAELKRKEHITYLELSFGRHRYSRAGTRDCAEALAEALAPSSNLEGLTIRDFDGARMPSWIVSLANLRRLTLDGCWECKGLPPLGKLPSLESLDLIGLESVRKVGLEFLGLDMQMSSRNVAVAFPKLRYLCLSYWDLEEWEDGFRTSRDQTGSHHAASCSVMPCLRSLVVQECLNLKALPDYLLTAPLESLKITGGSELLKRLKEGAVEEWRNKLSQIPECCLIELHPITDMFCSIPLEFEDDEEEELYSRMSDSTIEDEFEDDEKEKV